MEKSATLLFQVGLFLCCGGVKFDFIVIFEIGNLNIGWFCFFCANSKGQAKQEKACTILVLHFLKV